MDTLPELKHAEAEGRSLAFREAGEGSVLVLLHGIGSGSASWEAQLKGLSAEFRVIAWDAPGYGGSDPLAPDLRAADDYAGALGALLDALGIGAVHLVGHSLGAVIAGAFCRLFPERVLTLILADPTAGYAKAGDDLRVGRLEARLEAMDRLGPEGVAEIRSKEVLSPSAPPQIVEKVRKVQSRVRPEGYRQAARMLHGADLFADLPAIAVPALVLCGTADAVTPQEGCKRIASAIDGAAYRALEGLGHASYVEGPVMFNDALLAFVKVYA